MITKFSVRYAKYAAPQVSIYFESVSSFDGSEIQENRPLRGSIISAFRLSSSIIKAYRNHLYSAQ